MKYGFYKVAAATPEIKLASPVYNKEKIKELIEKAFCKKVNAIIFPELCLSGYTCGDLFLDKTLLNGCQMALKELIEETKNQDIICGVGVPVPHNSKLYNCIAIFHKGKLLGLAGKKFIPNYSEFYELRHFTPLKADTMVELCGQTVPMGEIIIDAGENFSIGYEVCEDMWVANPPSVAICQKGATVIMNSSCSDEIIGKSAYRKNLIDMHSGRLLCAYLYADSGFGESTTDMVFAGHRVICENATTLAESELFTSGLSIADIDTERLAHERRRMNTFENLEGGIHIKTSFDKETINNFDVERTFPQKPFVPSQKDSLSKRCKEITAIQSAGLVKRLSHINCKTAVIGLSGGLDSTLALLITVQAFDILGFDRKGIKAISMPCFGTTSRTKNNAETLAKALEVDFREIPISKAVRQHFEDIGHDESILDVTYENGQARERTQVLMDISNKLGGIVIGTGDLSELALGWATYNGDHMSMYGVNASVPKTLIRYLVNYFAIKLGGIAGETLFDILDTPVSPELLPPKDGEISQKTEDLVGPYELHDFFLYNMLRFGFSPDKIYFMAKRSFGGIYTGETIKKWLLVFYRRFFTQQFKRSCLPDAPKVGSISLSPRGDWRMPSDASYALWLEIAENIEV
ncbi:MAG: NAD(+) synthase [Clostridia bacterium]